MQIQLKAMEDIASLKNLKNKELIKNKFNKSNKKSSYQGLSMI